MPLTFLSQAPADGKAEGAGSTTADATQRTANAHAHHYVQADVKVKLVPALEGFPPYAQGALWVTEAFLSFYSHQESKGLAIPYSHISIHAKAKEPPTGSDDALPCVYCQIEDEDPDSLVDEAAEHATSREMWIWPEDAQAVDAIFSALSQCASMGPAYGDEAPAFVSESDYAAVAAAYGDGDKDGSAADSQAARFAAMGLDPASMVYATEDGGVAGPGLEDEAEGQWDDVEEEGQEAFGESAVADDDEDDALDAEQTMQEVIPGLWIGDYQAAQDHDLLQKRNIACVVSAMRQEYDAAPGVDMHRVAVDDTDKSNIIEHFVPTADFIHAALERNEGAVLVHCQAGVSRSTTLVVAYLMTYHNMNVEQAIARVRAARPQVDPSEFFMTQLELFERCNCEWDPVRYAEERRFLMSFAQAQIMEGVSPSIVLAYYPSPATTPKDRAGSFGFAMTSLPKSQISPPPSPHQPPSNGGIVGQPTGPATVVSGGSAVMKDMPTALPNLNMPAPPQRKRLTARKTDSSDNITKSQQAGKEKAEIAKIGSKGEVVISGRRLLCKICRRELAARDHIVAHDVGKGQQAFAPNRRDMTAYRAEQDRLRREAASGGGAVSPAATTPGTAPPASNPLAALRVAQPLGGGRMVQPRPSNVPRPQPVARPAPRQPPTPATTGSSVTEGPVSQPSAVTSGESAENEVEKGVPVERDMTVRQPVAQPEPPLLPSPACSSYFVEPLSWMGPTLETGVLAGKIVCPNKRCGAKLGAFDWAGNQCSCGAWVCPGFALNVSRVDEVAG